MDIIQQLDGLAQEHPGHGFWKMYKLLRKRGYVWNHKRVYRVYTNLKMNLRRKRHKRLPNRERQPIVLPIRQNISWSIDFMHDRLYTGRPFKVLNIIDDFSREAMAMEIDTGIGSLRLVRVLQSLKEDGLIPQEIRVDNGPEFLSQNFITWCAAHNVTIKYIQPGKPVQNAIVERFNGSYRREVLDKYAFETLEQAREQTHKWMMHYNYERPHDGLQDLCPNEFALKYGKLPHPQGHTEFSTFQHDNNSNNNNNQFEKLPTLLLH